MSENCTCYVLTDRMVASLSDQMTKEQSLYTLYTFHLFITYSYNGEKHLKVLQQDGKYGFSIPCTHKTLLDLVLHYSERSLVQHNPSLPTTLDHPLYEDKI